MGWISTGRHVVLGYSAIALLGLAIATWGAGTQLAGAVVAPATLRVAGHHHLVQHSNGGLVDQVYVRDGDIVARGDPLISFDGTFLKSERAAIRGNLIELMARKQRLIAERDSEPSIDFAPLAALIEDGGARYQSVLSGQSQLFHARLATVRAETALIEEQMSQIADSIVGLHAQISAIRSNRDLMEREMTRQHDLVRRGLATGEKTFALQRDLTRQTGELGKLNAEISKMKSEQSALALDVVHLEKSRRENAIHEIRNLAANEVDLRERLRRADENLNRLLVLAPVAGTVFEGSVFSRNEVVQPGATILKIVPGDNLLVAEARIRTSDVDQVHAGQAVILRFPSVKSWDSLDVQGQIRTLSADAVVDREGGGSHFVVTIAFDTLTQPAETDISLMPGMPAEALIRTTEKTPLAYLAEPFTRYFSRAFREG